MGSYTKNGHSISRLIYRVVFVTRLRRSTIRPEIMQAVEQYARYLIEEKYGGKLVGMGGKPDHLDILLELPATLAPAPTIGNLKTQLAKQIRQECSREGQSAEKGPIWTDSYYLVTTGEDDSEFLQQYIAEQANPRPKRKYTPRKSGSARKMG